MYERRRQPLAPTHVFYRRVLKNIVYALIVIALSLIIGVAGYHYTTGMSWVDALHNASMILGGMGLVDVGKVSTEGAKIFSSAYALFCGIIFITNMGIILAPVMHRVYHRLHLEEE